MDIVWTRAELGKCKRTNAEQSYIPHICSFRAGFQRTQATARAKSGRSLVASRNPKPYSEKADRLDRDVSKHLNLTNRKKDFRSLFVRAGGGSFWGSGSFAGNETRVSI